MLFEKSVIVINGESIPVSVSEMGVLIRIIKLHYIPIDLGDEVIKDEVGMYGKVMEVVHEEVEIGDGDKIFTGVRKVTIELRKRLPRHIQLFGVDIQPECGLEMEYCFKCGSKEGHPGI